MEECQAVADMQEVDLDNWEPLFDPTEFNKRHHPIQLESFRLPQEDLQQWAERCIRLRATINDRARLEARDEPDE